MRKDLLEENVRLQQRVKELEKALFEKYKLRDAGIAQGKKVMLRDEIFRALFDNVSDGIILARPDGRIDAANSAACKFLGMTEEEIIHADRDRILNLKDPGVAVVLEERARTGKTRGEITFLRKDGTPFPVEFNSGIYQDRLGEPRSFTFFHDITGRKRVEGQLRESESRYKELFENSGTSILIIDQLGKYLLINQNAAKLLGKSPEEVIGKSMFDFLPEATARKYLEFNRELMATGGGREYKDTFMLPGGEKTFLIVDQCLKNEQGIIFALQSSAIDISKRKRAEKERLESEERFSTIFRGSPVAIAIARRKNNQLIDVNDAWQKMTGFIREEVIGHTTRELNIWVNPADRDRIIGTLEEQGARENIEIQIRHKSGVVINTLMSAELIDLAGERCVLSLAQDITAGKKIEKALRENEERYRRVVEDQTEVISRFLADGTFTFANDVFLRFFGKTNQELLGTKWQPMAAPEDLPRIEGQLRTLSPVNPVIAIENRTYSSLGQLRWMQFINRGFFNSEGQIQEIQSVGRDITERKQLEEDLRVSMEFQRAVIDGLSANVAVIDETGTILGVNKAWREFADANPPVLRNVCEGANYIQVCESAEGRYSGGAVRFLKAIRKVFSGKLSYFGMEYPCHSPGQKRWFYGRVTAFPGEGPRRVVIAHEDITDRKRAENQVSIYQKKLRAMGSEMVLAEERERRRFSAGLHDRVGQNLALVKIKLGRLSKLKASPRQLSFIREINNLIEDIIQATRSLVFEISPPVLPELGLISAVEWVCEYFKEQYGIPVELKVMGKQETVKEHLRTLLFQALRELLNNIAKHSKATHVKIFLEQGKKEARIMVEDDGVGFESPSSMMAVHKKGYGLFNIREQFQHIGGKFKIISSPGKGTTAILAAPIKPGAKQKMVGG